MHVHREHVTFRAAWVNIREERKGPTMDAEGDQPSQGTSNSERGNPRESEHCDTADLMCQLLSALERQNATGQPGTSSKQGEQW